MPRKAAVVPNFRLHTTIPPNLATKLQLYMFSEVEGCIPRGAYQEFICARIVEFFDSKVLDLAPFTGQPPCANLVRGNKQTIERLEKLLKGETK